MDNERTSMVFYTSFLDALRNLPTRELQAEAALAIVELGIDGIYEHKNPYIKLMLDMALPNISKAKDRYTAAVENGKKGGRPQKVDRERVKQLLDEGNTVAEVAKELGCSTSTIYDIRKSFPETQKPNENLDIDKDNNINNNNETDRYNKKEIEIKKEQETDSSESVFWEERGKELEEITDKRDLQRVIGELAPKFGWGWLNYAMAGRAAAFNKHGFGLLYKKDFQEEVSEGYAEYKRFLEDWECEA